MNTYQVAVFDGAGSVSMHEAAKREPQRGQVLVKVDSCAICTLEQRVYKGIMKKYPFAGGHEVSGTVEKVGEQVKGVREGDKVAIRLLNSCGECYYCRNGHENLCMTSFIARTQECAMGPGGLAEYMMVNASDVYRLPEDIDLRHAALTEPLACCVHSIECGHIQLASDVVIIGAGIMGMLHLQLAKRKGARVIVCEVDEERLQLAGELGADICIPADRVNVVQEVKRLTGDRGADAVFVTAPASALASQGVEMTGKLGRTVFYTSFHPSDPIEIGPSQIHSTEQIITGAVNPQKKDFLIASRLLSFGFIDVTRLISGVYSLEELESAMEAALRPDTYRIIVRPSRK